jgi:starvation-inducible DNA-binding protein
MKTNNYIGLDQQKSMELADELNKLLANYSIFYQNTRAYHWNVKGDKFFELHTKFEELYNDIFIKIDEVAERILTLGSVPMHTYEDYIKLSEIKESNNTSNGLNNVQQILDAFKILITIQRNILDISGDLGDEGTNALMSDYIREQEKLVWMYSAYLSK